MLEKVKFICSKCGQEFNSKEACKTHENLCVHAYQISINISITLYGYTSKAKVYSEAHLYKVSIPSDRPLNKDIHMHKTMYCREDESETEIEYTCSKIVDETSSFRNELNTLKTKLVEFINSKIDETKEIFNSTETKDRLDKSINNALNRFKETGNKNA